MIKYVLCAFAAFTIASAQTPDPAKPRIFKAVRSPEVSAAGKVTFRFYAPNAKKVAVEREGFPRLAMTMDASGVWSATTEALAPDYYVYSYIVDGVQLSDPANVLLKPIVTGGAENLVHVPGPATLSWEDRDVPHGTVHRHRYRSAVIGETRDFLVYTPPGYDPAARRAYPVLYLLHGVMEGESAWTSGGRANVILDNLIADKKATPMLLVMPLGYGFADVPDRVGDVFASSAAKQRESFDKFGKTLFDEIVPQVEKGYRVSKERALAGLSMGGAQALYLGLNNPGRFNSVAALSGAFIMYGGSNDAWFPKLTGAKLPTLWIACGKEDFLIGSNRNMKTWLKSKGVAFTETETAGAHTWMVWRRNLTEYASTLFKGA